MWSANLDLSPGPLRSLMEKFGVLPKAKLSKTSKKIFHLPPVYLKNTVRVFDAMVLTQQLPKGVSILGDVSDHILNRITKNITRCVFLVSDQYDLASIKSLGREARSRSDQIRTTPR